MANTSQPLSTVKNFNPGMSLKLCVAKLQLPVTVMKVADVHVAKQRRTMTEQTDHWEASQKILVILAHPDDPEFFCDATLARWARAGHEITYYLLTCGVKGFTPTPHPEMSLEKLCRIGDVEQPTAEK